MTRLTDVDICIEKIKQLPISYDAETVQRCIEVLSNAPTIEAEPKWVPVTERLPKETGHYLVSLKTKGVEVLEEIYPDGFVYVSAYDAVTMHWGYGDKNVQAWMPLPKEYKGDKA